MFLACWKPKFYRKSKPLLKALKTRLVIIKKKRNAMVKFTKSDIAELLRNNFDMNAYGRAEGLLVEQNMLSCYDIIEHCIELISGQVSVLQKQMECPDECKEAVPTLMYAAARFGDLPELRELRALFTDKYGNSLDSYVNKEFVERLKSTQLSQEIKVRLLQDIAQEFSVEWDSKALQQKLYTPPPQPAQDDESKQRKRWDDDREYNLPNSSEDDSTSQDSIQTSSSSVGSASEEEADSKKPFYYRFIPPPYVKSTSAKEKSTFDKKPRSVTVRREKLKPPPGHGQKAEMTIPAPEAVTVRRNKLKPPPGHGPKAEMTIPAPEAAKLPDYDELAARIASIKEQ